MRTYYWYFTAYLRKHGVVLLLSIVGAIAVFSFFISAIANNLNVKPRRYVGLVGNYSLTSLPLSIQRQLSHGLTAMQHNGEVIPDLSERWTVENEGKTYRFVLKKNLIWQDGSLLTPADVTYNFRDVELAVTPNDIVFKLPDAFVPFPAVVSQPLLKTVDQSYWFFFTRPQIIGLGEYQLKSYIRNGSRLSQVIIESDQEQVVYRFYLTEEEALTAFKRGEVDILPDLATVKDVADWPTVTTTPTLHTDRYSAIFFNNSLPMFAKNVRQALAYALPKPDAAVRAIGPVSKDSWAFFEGGKTYDYDLSRATERMLEELPPEPLNFELTTTTTFQKEAEEIKTQWETFGQQVFDKCQQEKKIENKTDCDRIKIKVTVRINNYPDLSNYQALLIGQETPPDPDQYYLWHSSQQTNFTNYKNTRIDSLLERGRQTLEKSERLAIYQEFQQFFLEDAPVIFLRYLDSYEVRRQ